MQTIGYIAAGMILLPVLAVSLLGWGSLMGKLCRISFMEETAREEKILMGFFLLYFLTGSWNFFFPVGALFTTLFITAGTILTFFFRKEIKWEKRDHFLLIPLFIFAFFAIGRVTLYDANLYYLDTIAWINEYAVVPGLANLHSRFGFNQFFFYFPAMLEAVLPGFGASLANPFLGFLSIALFIDLGKKNPWKWLSALMLGAITAYSFRGELSSASPDSGATFFILIMLSLFACRIREKQEGRFTFFLFFATVAVLTKLSCAVISLAVISVVFLLEKEKIRVLCSSLPFALLLGGIWCLRSIILTGYFIYPVPWPSVDTAWRLSKETLWNERACITGWARMPGPDCIKAATSGFSFWIKTYFQNNGHHLLVYFRFFIIAMALWMYFSEKKREKLFQFFLLYIPIFLGLLFWWLMAPDLRFAFGLLLFAVLFPVASALEKFTCSRLGFWTFYTATVLIFLPPLATPKFLYEIIFRGYTPRYQYRYDVKTTDHGLDLNISHDMPMEEKIKRNFEKTVDRVLLPSTPYFNADLKLRGKTLQEGFVLEKKAE